VSTRRKVLLTVAGAGLLVVAVVVSRALPIVTGPALPAGAVRLHITTDSPSLSFGCAAALLSPGRLVTSGSELVLVSVETGDPMRVVWPSGFAAWQVDGRSVLADPWGSVVGRDGDLLDTLGGGVGTDDAFHICPFGIPTQP
jgi:hypothetical protein